MDPALHGGDLTARFTLGETRRERRSAAGFQLGLYFANEPAAGAALAVVQSTLAEVTERRASTWRCRSGPSAATAPWSGSTA
jgi:hypothetical protein